MSAVLSLPPGPEGARKLNAALSSRATSHWWFEDEFVERDRLVLRTVNDTVQHGVWNGLAGNDLSQVRQLGGKIVPG